MNIEELKQLSEAAALELAQSFFNMTICPLSGLEIEVKENRKKKWKTI